MIWTDFQNIMSATGVDAGSTTYSSVLGQFNPRGFCAMDIVVTATGTIAISQQTSADGVNWRDPIDAYGTALGVVWATSTTSLYAYIPFEPELSLFSRYKVTCTEDNTVTLKLIFQGDKE